jgi:peptide/nickel transport system ATP-binding protein
MPPYEVRLYIEKLLQQCGLPKDSFYKYPHHFSGGQRQRICIARALAMKPDVIIADEAVSALDVSIQKQILELLNELKHEHNLSYLFISHDLRVISQISDRVLVMHQGKIVEQGTVNEIFTNPQHSYTQKLLSTVK